MTEHRWVVETLAEIHKYCVLNDLIAVSSALEIANKAAHIEITSSGKETRKPSGIDRVQHLKLVME